MRRGAAARHGELVGLTLADARPQDKREAPVLSVLDRLTQRFPCVVGTLYWNGVVLAGSVTWEDGFRHDQVSDFDPAFIRRWRRHRTVLCWLHGSVHLNRVFSTPSQCTVSGWLWYLNARDALNGWFPGFQDDEQGRALWDFPVVLAGRKSLQVFRCPFFDYWTVFYEALMETSALVVMGYSGRDVHLNRFLQETLQHNSRLR
jgi:hypothetical protein